MATIKERLNSVTLGMMVRMFTGIGGTLVLLWGFSGDFIKAQAGEAFVEMLKEQGMDPEDFAAIKRKAGEIDTKTDELAQDLDSVKQSIGKISNEIQSQNAQSNRVESLVNQLLQLQLRRANRQ